MLIEWLIKCDTCAGKGKIKNVGMIEKECGRCKHKRCCASVINKVEKWFISNPFKTTPVALAVSLFLIMLFISYCYPYAGSFGVLIASFGAIFVALKYKLDQSSYHKSLFEERYAIFMKIDEILSAAFQDKDKDGKEMIWRDFSKELDSIYRKSYFLFGAETYKFIEKFHDAILQFKHKKEQYEENAKVTEAREFLQELLVGQELSKNFPELKIDFY